MVILTDHYKERYKERVGNASPAAQKSWIGRSLKLNRPKRCQDGRYSVKLVGSNHRAILSREYGNTWVALTVK
ncbi:MAG: hypothetical protein QMC95_06450 [Desulfitobacteriaceae bacterium]|nr:hypothetical protein [Desulfitobacteriaceae bacterium]